MLHTQIPRISVVVIGRNEGDRLIRCLQSIRQVAFPENEIELIYVDSQSTDHSPEHATRFGAKVLVVKPERPTAAWGRNAGWRAASAPYVLFLDGDTILHPDFLKKALPEFQNPEIAVVWGHRREINQKGSIYNRVLDLEWIYPIGSSDFCGGDALMRRKVLEEMGGYDEHLIAGEEPELCRRMRGAGYVVKHIDQPMTGHDLAMTSFSQYWKRAYRTGHAYAEIAWRFRKTSNPVWMPELKHNFMHGGFMLGLGGLSLSGAFMVSYWFMALPWILMVLLAARTARRYRWRTQHVYLGFLYGLHSHFQKIPIFLGQAQFFINRLRGKKNHLIEYKQV